MAAAVWPSSLPQTFVRNSRQESPSGQWLESQMETGPAKRRLRGRGTGVLQGIIPLDATEWATFLTFFQTTLGYGTLPFYFPSTGGVLVRFKEKPNRQTTADVLLMVSLHFEVLPP
jgi:hypothetical protein